MSCDFTHTISQVGHVSEHTGHCSNVTLMIRTAVIKIHEKHTYRDGGEGRVNNFQRMQTTSSCPKLRVL